MPKVSVILPTFNRAHTLEKAMRSVLDQSYRDLELIVVDDGSRDATPELVQRLAQEDPRVIFHRSPVNVGVCRARNIGLSMVGGDFVGFQDSDDEWLPDKLRRQVEFLESFPARVGLVYCLVRYFKGASARPFRMHRFSPDEPDLFRRGLLYHFRGIPIHACLIRKEAVSLAGEFDENFKAVLDDTEYLMRLARHTSFACLEDTLLNYYKTPGSLTSDFANELLSTQYLFEKYFDEICRDPEVLRVHYTRLAKMLRKNGRKWDSRIMRLRRAFAGVRTFSPSRVREDER